MKKRNIIILCTLAVICVAGLIVSHYVDWPVDSDNASGDIGKSSRFSRKQATESITNMEELLQNDTEYKNGIVMAYVVMQTRAAQFGSLVDMSNEVAGNINEFAGVLKDMNEVREMVNNVSSQLVEAGKDLNATLEGQKCPDLAQHTINASLAYTTLQKQNKLANNFIETTDEYLKSAQGDDRLKFVRDQWVDYQQMTAALENDKEAAELLAKKGSLLSAEKSLVALGSFEAANQLSMTLGAAISNSMSVDSKLCSALPAEALNGIFQRIGSVASETLQSVESRKLNMNSSEASALFASAAGQLIASVVNGSSLGSQVNGGTLGSQVKDGTLGSQVKDGTLGSQVQGGTLASQVQGGTLASQVQGGLLGSQVQGALLGMAQSVHVLGAFSDVMNTIGSVASSSKLNQKVDICSQLGDAINATSLGSRYVIER